MGLGGLPDEMELLVKMRSGDSHAFELLYNKYKLPLYLHTYNRLRDTEVAMDIVHDLFADFWAKRETIQINQGLSSYFYTSIRNRVINYAAHQSINSKYIHSFGDYLTAPEGTTDHLVREKQLMALIEKEIESLPPKIRLVFEMSRKENLSHKEIAQRLNLTDQTVRSYIKDALKILRVRLGIIIFLMLHQLL